MKQMLFKELPLYCFKGTVVLFVSIILFAGPALAGKEPSVKTCEEMGLLDVTCIICATGAHKGMYSVKAEYDPEYKDCGKRYSEARRECARVYNLEYSETGVKWSYYMGGTIYEGWSPKSCKH